MTAASCYSVRPARSEDYDLIVAVADDWWGRPIAANFARLFMDHFSDTSLIAERDGELAAFVVGFLSQARPAEAYIHFTGVAPAHRGSGLARDLYERFFARARREGRTVVKAITSPQNAGSIAFHRAMGFQVSDPRPDYDGPGAARVVFTRVLTD